MTCVKCKIHKWEDSGKHKTVHTDADGNNYCIFHAPSAHKGISLEEFNELVYNRINTAISRKQGGYSECNLSGTIFPGNISFAQYHYGNKICALDARNAVFTGTIDCDTVYFSGRVLFALAKFLGDAIFEHSEFSDTAHFTKAIFHNKANFLGARFLEKTFFSLSKFKSHTIFEKSAFSDRTTFSNATFADITNFKKCRFKGPVLFNTTVFNKHTLFSKSTFDRTPSFSKTNFKHCASFINTVFNYGATFDRSKFYNKSIFYECDFCGRVIFDNCHFFNTAIFRQPLAIDDIRFQNITNMEHVSLLNISLAKITFTNVNWGPLPQITSHNDTIALSRHKHRATIEFYRQMKKRCRDEHNDAEASKWHHAEKESQLLLLCTDRPCSFQRFTLEIYRFISRYGEDPRQALVVLLFLAVVLAFFMAAGAFSKYGPPPVDISPERVSNFVHVFSQYILFIKPDWTPPPVYDAACLFISRLLIPIQAAIFGFALRNKLHR